MRKYHIVTEIFLKDGYKRGRTFRVPTAPKEKGSTDDEYVFNYRSSLSISSFFFGIKERNQKKDEILYFCEWEDSHLRSEAITKENHNKHNIHYEPITYIEVDSIWDFYKLIGYDYKKKKYI